MISWQRGGSAPPRRAGSVRARSLRSRPAEDPSQLLLVDRGQLVFGALPQLPLPMEGLVRRHLDHPAAQRFRFAKPRQLGEQFKADRLENVRGVLRGRAVLQRNRVDQVLVLRDQRRPRLLVAVQTRANQPRIAPCKYPDCRTGVSRVFFSSVTAGAPGRLPRQNSSSTFHSA